MKALRKKISDIARVKGGKRLPKGEDLLSTETSNPYIRAQDIRDGRIRLEDPRYLTPAQHQKLKRYTVSKNDVCIVIVGVNVGDVGIVPKSLDGANLTENAVKLTDFRAGYIPHYVNYCLSTLECQAQMQQFAGGAAQPKLGIYKVLDIEIPVLPEASQHRVVEILSAYDDLVENNTRRIRILEEMATMIYREWFVNLHFPRHETLRVVESELGLIPEGWTVERLDATAFITMGQSPPSEQYNSTGDGLPFHQGVTDFGTRFPTDKMYCTLRSRIAEAGDILMSVRAPVGRLNISLKRIVIGRGLCAIRSRCDSQPFLFQQLKEHFREEDSMGSGTIFKAVTKEDVCGLKLLRPDETTTKEFVAVMSPVFRELELLTAQEVNLRQTRDLLLPKLISGQINVEHLEAKAVAQGI